MVFRMSSKKWIWIILLILIFVVLFVQLGIKIIGDLVTGKAVSDYGETPIETSTETSTTDKEIINQNNLGQDSESVEETSKTYYLINLLFSGNEFKILDFSLENGNIPVLEREDREFKINLFSIDDRALYSNSFSNPGILFSDGFDEGGVINLEDVEFNVAIPDLAEGYRFEILNGDGEVVLEGYVDDLK